MNIYIYIPYWLFPIAYCLLPIAYCLLAFAYAHAHAMGWGRPCAGAAGPWGDRRGAWGGGLRGPSTWAAPAHGMCMGMGIGKCK